MNSIDVPFLQSDLILLFCCCCFHFTPNICVSRCCRCLCCSTIPNRKIKEVTLKMKRSATEMYADDLNNHHHRPSKKQDHKHQAPCYESDEDTEDASESEMPKYEYDYSNSMNNTNNTTTSNSNYTELREQMYLDKLNNLREQLYQLDAGVHPEFIRQLKRVELQRQDRMLLNEAFQIYETERVEREYVNEKKAALREFEDRKIELRESLILELEDRRRMIENERLSIELLSDCADPKPVTTRKLRRRPNEPVPVPDKRRRTSPAQLNHQLEDKDIQDDLKAITKAQTSSKKPKEK